MSRRGRNASRPGMRYRDFRPQNRSPFGLVAPTDRWRLNTPATSTSSDFDTGHQDVRRRCGHTIGSIAKDDPHASSEGRCRRYTRAAGNSSNESGRTPRRRSVCHGFDGGRSAHSCHIGRIVVSRRMARGSRTWWNAHRMNGAWQPFALSLSGRPPRSKAVHKCIFDKVRSVL